MTPETTEPGADRLAADLELLALETDALLRSLDRLDDAGVAGASGCAGWTRGHVATHLARNAESLVRLVIWARTGVVTPQYPSRESRDADIAAGADRSAEALADDVKESADLLADALAALALPLATEVLEKDGDPFPALALPRRRLREVVLHHHDLRLGWTVADAHPLAVADALDETVAGLDPALDLTLLSTEGDRYEVGAGTRHVTGSAAALLLWLTRQDASGVAAYGPLPTLSWPTEESPCPTRPSPPPTRTPASSAPAGPATSVASTA